MARKKQPARVWEGELNKPVYAEFKSVGLLHEDFDNEIDRNRQEIFSKIDQQLRSKIPLLLKHYGFKEIANPNLSYEFLIIKMAQDMGVPGFNVLKQKGPKKKWNEPNAPGRISELVADVYWIIKQKGDASSIKEAVQKLILNSPYKKRWKDETVKNLANMFAKAKNSNGESRIMYESFKNGCSEENKNLIAHLVIGYSSICPDDINSITDAMIKDFKF